MDDLRLRCVSLSSEKEVHDVLKQAFKVRQFQISYSGKEKMLLLNKRIYLSYMQVK